MMERALAEALVGGVENPRAARRAVTGPAPRAGTYASKRIKVLGAALLGALGVLAIGFVLNRPGRGATAGSPESSAAVANAATGPVARKLPVPGGWTYIGRPAVSGRYLTYVDNSGDLALMDPAGGQRNLTNKGDIDEAGEMASAVSADGTRVAYAWRTLDNHVEMRVISIDGKWPRVLVKSDDVSVPHPIQWSRDEKQILSLLERTDRTNALAMVDSATGGVTVIKDFGRVRPQHASMSPDGRYVAFDYPQDRHSDARDIFLIAADGKHEAPLIRHESSDMFPMWTVDGTACSFFR